MKKALKAVDFDKDLTNGNTMLRFVRFCTKKSKMAHHFPFLMMILANILVKCKLLHKRTQVQFLIKRYCPHKLAVLENYAFEFAQNIPLTQYGKKVKKNNKIIIYSTGIKSYIQYLFPNHQIRAFEIKTDKRLNVIGIK